MSTDVNFRAIDPKHLVPEQWSSLAKDAVNIFNLAVIEVDSGYLAAYRFVSSKDMVRRIAICRLDADLEVIPGSAIPASDLITFADPGVSQVSKNWFADPRLFKLRGEIYMVWNNGHTDEDTNHQYMAKLNQKTGEPNEGARELILRSARRKTEKNWAFFEAEGQVWAVYSVSPHRILRVDMDSSKTEILCDMDNISTWKSTYSEIFGALRGGAQPIKVGDKFINIVHSRYNMPGGSEYVAAIYEFSAKYPFNPINENPYPLNLNFDPHSDPAAHGFSDEFSEKLNPTTSWVLYPTGFAVKGSEFIISGGYNDSHSFLATGELSYLSQEMKKIKSSPQPKILPVDSVDGRAITKKFGQPVLHEVPLFWWNAKGGVMSPKISDQVFRHGNFGDDASWLLINELTGLTSVQAVHEQNKLLAIGSILHRANSGDIVWGSGLKGVDALADHPGGDIFVRAVRGPMTLDVLKKAGWDVSNVTHMFDPGALLAHLWKDELAKYPVEKNKSKGKIRILPHFRDEIVFKRWYPKLTQHFISADNHPLTVLKQMLGAELVISSSLHGLIFAESLGIPAIWIDSPGKEAHFKYLDYYAGTGRTNIQAVGNLLDAMNMTPPPLPTFNFQELLDTFPKKEIEELAERSRRPIEKILYTVDRYNVGKPKFNVGWSETMVNGKDAYWVKGLSGSFTLSPAEPKNRFASIRILVKRCETRFLGGQTLTVTTSAGSQATLRWAKGDLRSKQVVLPVSSEALREGLTVHLRASKIGPRLNWLRPFPLGSVGVVSVRSN